MQNLSFEILVAIILVLLFSVLGLLLWHGKNSNRAQIIKKDNRSENTERTCPLCGETLERGLRVHSTLFLGKEFNLMRIFGCAYCWDSKRTFISNPVPHKSDSLSVHQNKKLNRRLCPCCNSELPEGGYAIARVYQKPYRLPHVHVYGCTTCKPCRE